ncbi:MAG: hypothetical protein FRX49_09963 [Trebouxia sp. A1-2]|nr:MAG: hypothetical protein FRX49_09963 [Trebouxia sp. A1-2]
MSMWPKVSSSSASSLVEWSGWRTVERCRLTRNWLNNWPATRASTSSSSSRTIKQVRHLHIRQPQNLVSIQPKGSLYHGSPAPTVEAAILPGIHGRPHQAILCDHLEGLGHVRIQLHIAGRVLDDVPFQLPLHMGAVEGLLHQLVQAGVAVAEVLARQGPLIKPVYHLFTSQKGVHNFMHVDDN